MKNNKLNAKKEKYLFLSMGAAIILLVAALLSMTILPVSSNNEWLQANVTVGNAGPLVSNVNFTDGDGDSIQLTVSSNTNWVNCNGTITDENGYADVLTANATFFYNLTNISNGIEDKNSLYRNASTTNCTLFGGTGLSVLVNCSLFLEHEAVNGTWACNITAIDMSGAYNSSVGYNEVDQLIALSVLNDTLNFGSMTNGQNTTAGLGINISNEGNVMIDIDVKSNTTDMSCTTSTGCLGAIGVGNITFNLTQGTYDEMRTGYNLTDVNQTMTAFDLYQEGIGTVDDLNSTRYVYWGIQIPQGVKGEFNTNITISALIG